MCRVLFVCVCVSVFLVSSSYCLSLGCFSVSLSDPSVYVCRRFVTLLDCQWLTFHSQWQLNPNRLTKTDCLAQVEACVFVYVYVCVNIKTPNENDIRQADLPAGRPHHIHLSVSNICKCWPSQERDLFAMHCNNTNNDSNEHHYHHQQQQQQRQHWQRKTAAKQQNQN